MAAGNRAPCSSDVSTHWPRPVRWPAGLLVSAAAIEIGLGLPFTMPLLLLAALLLGFVSQGVKISVDTLVQQHVDDGFRGRVFSVYDALFNVTLVLAAALTALALPENGRSGAAIGVIAIGYLVTAAVYVWRSSRVDPAALPASGVLGVPGA